MGPALPRRGRSLDEFGPGVAPSLTRVAPSRTQDLPPGPRISLPDPGSPSNFVGEDAFQVALAYEVRSVSGLPSNFVGEDALSVALAYEVRSVSGLPSNFVGEDAS
jgi:hypothetical protein